MIFTMKSMPWRQALAAGVLALTFGDAVDASAIQAADIVVLMDESGSMTGEQAWIGGAISALEASLNAREIGAADVENRYALVGFGGSDNTGGIGIGPGGKGDYSWMSAPELVSASGSLAIKGGTEDGYSAVGYFFDKYEPRSEAALNVILVTDEDRDVYDAGLTQSVVLDLLAVNDAMLNVVVNGSFEGIRDRSVYTALGLDAAGNAYIADSAGGFDKVVADPAMSGYGTTISDYVDVALMTGGAAWDLNQLRAGGAVATSFTQAFVDIKTDEIERQIPEPAPLLLMSIGMLAMGRWRGLMA